MRLRNKKWTDKFINDNDFMLIKDNNKNVKFKNNNPIYLEIGCGKGKFVIENAINNLQNNYIGVEKSKTVTGIAIKKAIKKYNENNIDIDNLLFLNIVIRDIKETFAENQIDKLFLNFSDPWMKKRHAKKRLTTLNFLNDYSYILKKGALLEIKTDNDILYEYTIEQISLSDNWEMIENCTDLYKNKELLKTNISTEYEDRFHSLNKNIYKIILKNKK